MQGSEESCSEEYMPDWLKKCLTCKHAYKTKDNDHERTNVPTRCSYKQK